MVKNQNQLAKCRESLSVFMFLYFDKKNVQCNVVYKNLLLVLESYKTALKSVKPFRS